MAINITEIKDESFKEFISNRGLVLVDFLASWCNPCKALSPTIDQLSIDYLGKVSIGKLDVDECPKASKELEIRSIPTIVLYKDGKVIERLVGSVNKQKISDMIDKHI